MGHVCINNNNTGFISLTWESVEQRSVFESPLWKGRTFGDVKKNHRMCDNMITLYNKVTFVNIS